METAEIVKITVTKVLEVELANDERAMRVVDFGLVGFLITSAENELQVGIATMAAYPRRTRCSGGGVDRARCIELISRGKQ